MRRKSRCADFNMNILISAFGQRSELTDENFGPHGQVQLSSPLVKMIGHRE